MNFKKIIPFKIKYNLRFVFEKYKKTNIFSKINLDKNKNRAYIFLAADYGNLGDVAITFSQTEFLKKHSNYQIIEIPISQSIAGLHWLNKNIQKDDLITIIGGGNIGDLYEQIEYIRQLVIKSYPKNKIISFPQSIDFSNTNFGKKQLEQAKKVYNSHKNLVLVAREEVSYLTMKDLFPKVKIILTPDIVLSQDQSQNQKKRQGLVVCLRDDAEKSLSKQQQNTMLKILKNHFKNNLKFYDTHIGRNNLSIDERNHELTNIWNIFKGAELVVTDRLHGMIFCYITQTPCIVLQNNNHKIKGTINWIKNCGYIHFIENFDEFHFKETLNQDQKPTQYQSLQQYYSPLISEL